MPISLVLRLFRCISQDTTKQFLTSLLTHAPIRARGKSCPSSSPQVAFPLKTPPCVTTPSEPLRAAFAYLAGAKVSWQMLDARSHFPSTSTTSGFANLAHRDPFSPPNSFFSPIKTRGQQLVSNWRRGRVHRHIFPRG